MNAKRYASETAKPDPRQRAGAAAEAQIAHYLNRSLGQDPEVHLFNGLRLADPQQPDRDGSPGVCRIDHLIVHRWGMFIVESKSAMQEGWVPADGSAGDGWSCVDPESETGAASPVQQARRQSEFLRALLQRHRKELVGRRLFGLPIVAWSGRGKEPRGFTRAPIQLVVAVPYRGMIKPLDGWTEPRKPFGLILTRAELVPDKVVQELDQHRSGSRLSGYRPAGEYGLWSLEPREVAKVARFLGAWHAESCGDSSPAQFPEEIKGECVRAMRTHEAVCKYCAGKKLTARWGQNSYHWRCGDCGRDTPLPAVCASCGAKGRRGKGVRIRKRNTEYSRECEACGFSETIWTVV